MDGVIKLHRGATSVYVLFNANQLLCRRYKGLYVPEFGKVLENEVCALTPKENQLRNQDYIIVPEPYVT